MTDKPLHVRVAEALGWHLCLLRESGQHDLHPLQDWTGFPPGRSIVSSGVSKVLIPRYDTDWSATGPLIEKYGIHVFTLVPGDLGLDGFHWGAQTGADIRSSAEAFNRYAVSDTPLLAICNLILALSEAGKLPA